ALKFDALQHRNLVFSPKGDVYDLPRAATPVDYAYAVHTKLGTQAIGAKVNGKMVSLDHKLQNGDVVEIIVDRKRTKPNLDWLKFVVTTAAKREIIKNSKV
ncbi:MAG: TGS domain-containing protein, partial [Candidatus Amesbacteria bacterium]|nr:TGS domain-containing protein [Candidatus Amesbacteria bacterium]